VVQTVPDESRYLYSEQEIRGIFDQLTLFLVGISTWVGMYNARRKYVRVESDVEFSFL
jgi:hypothetical protein